MTYSWIGDGKADVVPLQVSGAVDTDMSKLMAWGLANLWKEGKEGGYGVRHSHQPVNDFGCPQPGEQADENCPNFFEQAFPCLFPYGEGGIERDHEVTVEFNDHAKWLLRHHDRRFRQHETFPFVTFGIMQHCQVLASARLQMQ